jgi:hypothetical protein
MVSSTLQFLITINNNYANLILAIVAVISAIVAYTEYVLRRRPYVMPEMIFEENEGKWYFHILLVNKGEYPSIVKIAKAVLKIGDEEYPTTFNFEAVLSPTEKQKLAPIGHINEIGRKKITGHEYRNNRVEISVNLVSKGLGQKKFKYLTEMEYEVDVSGEKPVFQLIREGMV